MQCLLGFSETVTLSRGGLGRRDTGKIPGGPPGPVILIIIKMHARSQGDSTGSMEHH